jgi:hypothetical protein
VCGFFVGWENGKNGFALAWGVVSGNGVALELIGFYGDGKVRWARG